jgi:NAD(P)-dependent dehydrogenase (short-subunit alcohol dehydrogenase family)
MTARIALVTGAARGIGRQSALTLASDGLRVVLTYRGDADSANEVIEQIRSAGGEALAMQLDLADVASFRSFAQTLTEALHGTWGASALDVLVNNAGIGLFNPLETATAADFDAMFATNVRGTFFLIQALAPLMADGGRIVNVSSSLTRQVSAGTSLYSASKSAIESITRTLASELGPRGIRVNSVAPGPTATDFNGGAMRDNASLRDSLSKQTALGRVGEAEEIADAIVALASHHLRWVTGERVEVSGGSLL